MSQAFKPSGLSFRQRGILVTATADIQALRESGLDDQQIFAITAFVALRLAFSTINDSLGAQPDAQLVESLPAEVREAVTYGRAATQAPAPSGSAAASQAVVLAVASLERTSISGALGSWG
jgi:hypothetical protein